MREISINLDCGQFTKEMRDAIGYLSMWAFDMYDKVVIYRDHGNDEGGDKYPDLIAYYQNTTTWSKYVIGAVWNESTQQYSFHS